MQDLTKITTPFGLLDKETQERLIAHDGPTEFFGYDGEWEEQFGSAWNKSMTYRVKPQPLTKPSIDWSHVAPQFKWLARNTNGQSYLYCGKPSKVFLGVHWSGAFALRVDNVFASYTPGTCDWKDSLVQRPEGV